MSDVPAGALLWDRVFAISEAIDEGANSIPQLQSLLCGLEEGFADASDPVENFPEFVTLRLCRSVGHLLAQLDTPQTS